MKRTLLKSCLWIGTLLLLANRSFSATFVVSSNANAGPNTLRQAIIDANALPGPDNIVFNFGGATTITLTTCQQEITGPVDIDGYTNPGAGAGVLMIEVVSPAGCRGFDFAAGSDGSSIRGIVISGGATGIYLRNSNGHTIRGNYIGTNMAGTAWAASRLQNGIHANTSNNNVIGGTGGQIDRNLLSGATQCGVRLEISTGAIITGNYVGTDVTGNIGIANGEHGIYGYNNSHNPRVGGTTPAERNIVSSSTAHGIYFNNCSSPVIKGNIVGLGLNGSTPLGNGGSGINLEYVGTGQVGGLTAAERNVSSNNGGFGVVVRNSNGTVIQGNWLGIDMATGLLDHGNYDAAITVTASADVIIGGDVPGAGNICSGSGNPGGGADGISIWANSPRPVIKGNIIGLGIDGTTPLQNYGHGIECVDCADGIIGGPTLAERNVVAASFLIGLQLVNSPRIRVVNTYVGTDASGMLDRGGSQVGVAVSNSPDAIIGSGLAGEGNIISGNAETGIVVSGTSSGTIIKGNIIGLGADGSTVVRNDQMGIRIAGNSGVSNCVVGGPSTLERNIISGNGTNNGHHGIFIDGGSSGHQVQNNYIGTDATGTLARGNGGTGIFVNNCSLITITQNISSNNGNKGIELTNASNNTVTGNYIGTDVSGSLNMGNANIGIRISATSVNNIIGGSLANANVIANNNTSAGVWVEPNGQRNTITYNSIYCNTGLGIDLEGSANESVPPPVISFSGPNSVNGTGINGHIIHVYRNDKADGGVKCNCEGEIYIGTTVVSGGVWEVIHNLGLTAAQALSVTSTHTTSNGSTSEFTPCSIPLPVQWATFEVTKNTSSSVLIFWATLSEKNNDKFELQRSSDGIHFYTIAVLPGMGNSSTLVSYSFLDEAPEEGINYYRLKQIDYDGQNAYSGIRTVDFRSALSILPVPGGFSLQLPPGSGNRQIQYELYTLTGALAASGKAILSDGQTRVVVKPSLASSVYVAVAYFENTVARQKILLAE